MNAIFNKHSSYVALLNCVKAKSVTLFSHAALFHRPAAPF